MYMVQCIIAATNTAQRVIPLGPVIDNANTCFQSIVPQNNGANNMYLGDPSVSKTNSLILYPSTSVGSLEAFSSNPGDLKDFYVIGTAGDILNIMVIP